MQDLLSNTSGPPLTKTHHYQTKDHVTLGTDSYVHHIGPFFIMNYIMQHINISTEYLK